MQVCIPYFVRLPAFNKGARKQKKLCNGIEGRSAAQRIKRRKQFFLARLDFARCAVSYLGNERGPNPSEEASSD